MKFQVIDLFCGAGGVTSGIKKAVFDTIKIAEVVACLNHDLFAIKSHKANHASTIHFTEDLRTFDLSNLPELDRSKIIVLWASLECTNFSKAKGGKPRDPDSRTLANHLFRYIDYLSPDYIMIENVREFMSWGPLDKNGKPVSMENGKDYLKWVKGVKSYGYEYDFRLLNAADFGARCLRNRYFGLFAKPSLPLIFPQPFYCKKGNKKLNLKKWRAVKPCLDLKDEGKSIFGRQKPLCENTLKRIYEGLKKFATKEQFIIKFNSNHKRNGKLFVHQGNNIEEVAPTITTQNRLALINCNYLIEYHGAGNNVLDTNSTLNCITTKDRFAAVFPLQYIDLAFSSGTRNQSIENPSHAVLCVDKKSLLTTYQFIINRQYNNKSKSIDEVSNTIIARQGKRPMYLISPVAIMQDENVFIIYDEYESATMRKIKFFMTRNNIVDIKMRMLKVAELKRIMGLNTKYKLFGDKTKQKWMIGNMVHPIIPKFWFETLYKEILKDEVNTVAA